MESHLKDDKLRQLGLKITVPRLKVLHLFEQYPDRHFSAEALCEQLNVQGENVSVATVYRVLNQFEAAGLLEKHSFEEHCAVYELNKGEHHDHLVCVKCGCICEFLDEEIEQRQESVAKQFKFQITDHRLVIYGLCESCSERKA